MNPTNIKTCQQATGTLQMGRPVLCGRQVAPGSDCCEHHNHQAEPLEPCWTLHKAPAPPTQMQLL